MASYIHHVEIPAYRTILTGPNGSGKSSALEWIVKQAGSATPAHIQWSEPPTPSTMRPPQSRRWHLLTAG